MPPIPVHSQGTPREVVTGKAILPSQAVLILLTTHFGHPARGPL
jgi:hypothetical protein